MDSIKFGRHSGYKLQKNERPVFWMHLAQSCVNKCFLNEWCHQACGNFYVKLHPFPPLKLYLSPLWHFTQLFCSHHSKLIPLSKSPALRYSDEGGSYLQFQIHPTSKSYAISNLGPYNGNHINSNSVWLSQPRCLVYFISYNFKSRNISFY